MSEQEHKVLKEERNRRKRVQHIRTGIITVISVWIVLSIVITCILCAKVISLQKQINIMTGEYDSSTAVVSQVNQSAGDADSIQLTQNTMDKENLATAEDLHKVYLTFDDGPSENTNAILDILDDYGIKATFFVTGKEDEASKAAYQRIVAEGHTIAMHSYSHKYSELYASKEAFQEDFERIQNLIYDTTGVECHYYRFPGGSSNKVSNTDMSEFISYLNEQGITYYDWNVSSGDATSRAFTADELVENVMSDVVKYKTSVVLLHDATVKTTTVQALPAMIEALQQAGAMILPIDEDTTVIQHVSIQQ
mgnify:FL=1